MQTQIESDPILLVEHSASLLAVLAGDGLDLAVTVTNRGKQSLMVDVFIDGTANDLNRWCRCAWQRIALDARQARTIVFRFEIPVASPPGHYKAVVVADASSLESEDALQQLLQVCPIQFDVLSAPAPVAVSSPLRLPKPSVLVLLVALLGLGGLTALFRLTAPRTATGPVQPVAEPVSVLSRPSSVQNPGNLLPGAVMRVVAEAEASQASLARSPVQWRTSRRVAKPIPRTGLTKKRARRIAARRPTSWKRRFASQQFAGRSMAIVESGAATLALHAAAVPLIPPPPHDEPPLRPVPPTEHP